MSGAEEIVFQVESLIRNEVYTSHVEHTGIRDAYLMSVGDIIRQVELLIRNERYPLVLDGKEIRDLVSPN